MTAADRKIPTSAAVPSAKRLALLEQMVATGHADAFARYGLAMEYRKAGRIDDALAIFRGLREVEPGYIPQYLMAGQMLSEVGRLSEAREWLEAGKFAAQRAGDRHALGELTDALASLD